MEARHEAHHSPSLLDVEKQQKRPGLQRKQRRGLVPPHKIELLAEQSNSPARMKNIGAAKSTRTATLGKGMKTGAQTLGKGMKVGGRMAGCLTLGKGTTAGGLTLGKGKTTLGKGKKVTVQAAVGTEEG